MLRSALDSATVVPARQTVPDEVLFGTTVTVRVPSGERRRHRIVGVDETTLEEGWVSWVSPLARALLGAQVGQQITIPGGAKVEIIEIAS